MSKKQPVWPAVFSPPKPAWKLYWNLHLSYEPHCLQRLTSLRSAGHLENVPPGTAADRRYKSWEHILLLICVRSAGYVADCSTADEHMFVAPCWRKTACCLPCFVRRQNTAAWNANEMLIRMSADCCWKKWSLNNVTVCRVKRCLKRSSVSPVKKPQY